MTLSAKAKRTFVHKVEDTKKMMTIMNGAWLTGMFITN